MNNINEKLEKIMPIINKISNNKYLQSISEAMVGTLPITIIGSLAVLLMVFPITAIKDILISTGIIDVLNSVNQFTLGSLAIYVSFLTAKNLVSKFNKEDDGVRAGIISLICFFIVTPITVIESTSYLSFEWTGSTGIFTALFIGLIVGRIYIVFATQGLVLKVPESVPPMVRKTFESLLPCIFIAILFIIIEYIFELTPYGNLHQAIYSVIQKPMQGFGGNIWSIIIVATIGQILCFFGLHGTNITMPLVQPIWMAMDVENLSAAAAGLPLPNTVGYAFFVTYTLCATAIGFTVMMLFAKSKQYRLMGKVAAPAAIFGISEPMIFGTPLVLNFNFAIPFIFGNAVALIVAYVLTITKIVPPLMGVTPVFGLPLGFHATVQGDWRIILLQIFTQIIVAVLWYPFFKKADNEAYIKELELEKNQ